MWLYHRVMSPNHADGKANSVDPDQTLFWVCTVCPGISARKLGIITGTSYAAVHSGYKSLKIYQVRPFRKPHSLNKVGTLS